MTVQFGDARLPARFWAKVQQDASGCWLWTGGTNRDGYGQMRINGRTQGIHRAIFGLTQDIPAGLQIDHTCTVRACCNPAHLRAVTQQQNLQRKQASRGSSSSYRGVGVFRREGDRRDGMWQAYITPGGKMRHLGFFTDEWEAACAAHEARLAAGFFGEAEDWALIVARRTEPSAA